MKKKIIVLMLALCMTTFYGFAQSSTGENFLFRDILSRTGVYQERVRSDVGFTPIGVEPSYHYELVNIGFTAAKRVIYDNEIRILAHVLPDSALAVLDERELWILLYTIGAIRGHDFSLNSRQLVLGVNIDAELVDENGRSMSAREYFSRYSWYNPRTSNPNYNDIDASNFNRIASFLQLRGSHPYIMNSPVFTDRNVTRGELVRHYLGGFPVPSWTPELKISLDDTIEWEGYNDYWKGTYRIENGLLIVHITEQYIGNPSYINSNWRWPAGITYRNGWVFYREPIRLVFPVYRLRETARDEDYVIMQRRIGSFDWIYPVFFE